jgi:hypothetical protein
MHVTFEATDDPAGIRIVDSIERRRIRVETSGPVDVGSSSTDRFRYPVDAACTVETDELRFDRLDDTYVRDADGSFVTAFSSPDQTALPAGSYSIEISGPIKLYCRVESEIAVNAGADSLAMQFPDDRRVVLGARSYHKHPAGTVATPPDPESLMSAIEATSSALKTTSCERSYPTLRGHPPLLELGEELAIPDGISSPETDVTLVLPRDRRSVYTAAPLAFYLGADVVPGESARIETPSVTHTLGRGRDFEDEVARTLKRSLFLDTIVRTEGLYRIDLYERRQVERALPFDVESLYGKPLHEQLSAYLEVPFEAISEFVPTWVLTAHLPSAPASVEAVPFVLNDLGIIREPRGSRYDDPQAVIDDYSPVLDRGSAVTRSTSASAATRSTASEGVDGQRTLVEPVPSDESIDHAWFGPNVPVGASKATVEAFRNRLYREEQDDDIAITVVCNDERMLDEQVGLGDVYGRREDLPFDVTSHFGLSRDEFADLLERDDSDFLHYIGHATPDGLRCLDEPLDVRSLDSVGIDVFFLNACDAYEQALALTERGALGGVGTIGDVVNEYAIDAGKLVARLLNQGYPLRAAMTLVREYTVIGDQYLVVGDGSVDVAQTEGGPPTVYTIESRDDDRFEVTVESYPTRIYRIGSYFQMTTDEVDENFLLPGETRTVTMEQSQLRDYFFWFSAPVWVDGELHWSDVLDSPV